MRLSTNLIISEKEIKGGVVTTKSTWVDKAGGSERYLAERVIMVTNKTTDNFKIYTIYNEQGEIEYHAFKLNNEFHNALGCARRLKINGQPVEGQEIGYKEYWLAGKQIPWVKWFFLRFMYLRKSQVKINLAQLEELDIQDLKKAPNNLYKKIIKHDENNNIYTKEEIVPGFSVDNTGDPITYSTLNKAKTKLEK